MAKGFQLICPTKLETSVTGFVGGIEKEHNGRLFRIEFRRGGVVCTKNGSAITWEDLPHPIRKAAHAGADMIKQANQMAGSAT